MKKAISYARFSSAIQAEGHSEKRQAESFAAFCKTHQLEPMASFIDKGKSGYKGHHRQGAFGAFLAEAQAGAFPRGSVLVVEALDRFSREEPLEAASTLKAICKAGIDIGICNKGQIFTHSDLSDMGKVISLIVDMCAAHDFSSKLSMRMKAARKGMREDAKKTKACPSWLSLVDGSYVLNEKALAMKEACMMSIAGYGSKAIGDALQAKGYSMLYTNYENLPSRFRERTLIGEYQPMCREGKRKVKAGDTIADFYPALLSMVEFRALQDALDSRINGKGHIGVKSAAVGKRVYLFSMLQSTDGDKLQARPQESGCVHMITNGARYRKPGSVYKALDYDTIETALLLCLSQHITPMMLNPVQAQAETEAQQLKAKMADLTANIKLWEEEAIEGKAGLSRLISSAADKLATMQAKMETLCHKAAHNQASDLAGLCDLISLMKGQTGAELLDTRVRLKTLVSNIVETITIDRVGNDPKNLSFVVCLKSGVMLVGSAGQWKEKVVAVWEEKSA